MAVPAQDRARGDQAMAAQGLGQQPDEGGEDCPLRPVRAWSRVGAAEYRDLMSQHEQSDVLLKDQLQAAAATRWRSCPTAGECQSPLVSSMRHVLEPHRLRPVR